MTEEDGVHCPLPLPVAVAGPVAIALAEPQWVVIKTEQSGERGVVETEGQWLLKINTSTRVHKLSQPPVHIVVTQRLLSPLCRIPLSTRKREGRRNVRARKKEWGREGGNGQCAQWETQNGKRKCG